MAQFVQRFDFHAFDLFVLSCFVLLLFFRAVTLSELVTPTARGASSF